MNKILDNRVIFVTNKLIAYPKKIGMGHQKCMEDFAQKQNLLSARGLNFVKHDICVFQLLKIKKDNYEIYGFLPESLTNEQLEILYLLGEEFDKVSRFEMIKLVNNKTEYYEANENCKEIFIEGILNAYNNKDNTKIK